jgi:glycosyltransferase involved in cell wall biosynthesis
MIKKAAIYDPYLDTLGGGERYCLTIAEILINQGYQVDIFWSGDQDILKSAQKRFLLNLEKVNIVPDIFGLVPKYIDLTEEIDKSSKIFSHQTKNESIIKKFKNFLNRFNTLKKYDFCFYLSDGSIPFLFAKKNILHIQVPFKTKDNLKLYILNYLKSLFIYKVVTNSNFTSSFLNSPLKSKILTLYPPVAVDEFLPSENKKNIILSVGRFDNLLNAKKQDILIEVFKKFVQNNPASDWRLQLAGASLLKEDQNNYLNHLKSLGKNFPIEFYVNPEFQKLKSLYSEAKIYWHAAGFGVDENIHPEETEHFGITPVEAMASGCVPFLVNKGGLKEIITDDNEGYLWDQTEELLSKTQLLISTPNEFLKFQQNSINTSQKFSRSIFEESLLKILSI